jgi:uncharacterized Zn finger protein
VAASLVRCDACQKGNIEAITVRELYGKDYPASGQQVKDTQIDTVFRCSSCGKVFGVTSTTMTERRT